QEKSATALLSANTDQYQPHRLSQRCLARQNVDYNDIVRCFPNRSYRCIVALTPGACMVEIKVEGCLAYQAVSLIDDLPF
ncbi:MAG TPA: hypothetical protein VHW90_14585, partial [Stellaceae bacterium]|nr:hypothetical protein [Stellaceae bacterium]